MEKQVLLPATGITKMNSDEQAKRLWNLFNDKVLDAFVGQCRELVESGGNLRELARTHNLSIDLQEKYESMRRVLAQTEAILVLANSPNEGWKSIEMDDKCQLAVKANGTFLQMKSKGLLQTNVKNFLYLAYLIKLYTNCLPFCKESHDIKQVSRLQKIGFVRLSIPIPFIKDRCTFLRGVGFDRIDKKGSVCIYAEGISLNKQYLEQVGLLGECEKLMKGRELLDLKHFAVELKCVGEEETEYCGYALVDHHIPLLPERLISFVAKEMAKYLFNNLMKKLMKFEESVWAAEARENYDENREFYDWITMKVRTWVDGVIKKEK